MTRSRTRSSSTLPAAVPAANPAAHLYAPLDFFVVRTPLLPVEAYQALGEPSRLESPYPVSGENGGVVASLLGDPRVRRALAVGSPALADALERSRRGTLKPRDAERLQAKLLRYLIRMSTRPTPYGLFAGVALAQWADETDLVLATTTARTRTRPDMGWLWALILKAEARPEVRRQLRLIANSAAFVRAGRVVLAERAPSASGGAGQGVSVRASGAVRRALEYARRPVPYNDLAEYLLATVPGATTAKVEALLTELWQQTLLLTDLRPPATTTDPARYVAERLEQIPEAKDALIELRASLESAAEWDSAPPENGRRAHVTAAEPSDEATTEADALFQVDAAVGLKGDTLHREVGLEAARAAELLLRLSPFPSGIPYLAAYLQSFTVRYGHDREVPLLELLDPQVGLGPPGYHNAGMSLPFPKASQRTQTLRDLAFEALRDHLSVIELDAQTMTALETWTPNAATAPRSIDLYAYVAAASREAVDAGQFKLVVGPNIGVPAAGRSLGRFADLLAPEGPAALERAARAEEALTPSQVWAELCYMPQQGRLANVTIRPATRRYEIPVGMIAGVPLERTVALADLVVGVRNGRFYLRWLAENVEVVVTSGHMLNTLFAPVVVRFLSDISRDGQVQLSGFDWGPMEGAPFLPRVEVGRVVLRSAQWSVGAHTLPPDSSSGFAVALDTWRKQWSVPRYLYVSHGDNRLIVDLNDGQQVEELRTEIRALPAGGGTALQEVIPALDQVWLQGPGGHFIMELVVPLVLGGGPLLDRAAAARVGQVDPADGITESEPVPARPGEVSIPEIDPALRLRPPGSEWLYVKLYCSPTVEDDLVAEAIRPMAEQALADGWAEEWFFIRYADPDNHLRLRFRGLPESLTGRLLPALCAWADNLMQGGHIQRFGFDTYEREIERYGGPEGMEIAESIFAADSRMVAGLLQLIQGHALELDRTTLAVLTVDELLACLGLTPDQRIRWYEETVISRDQMGAEYRQRKALLRSLLGDPQRLSDQPGGEALRQLLTERCQALAPCAARLASGVSGATLSQSREALCRSFVHLHCNRFLGMNNGDEQRVLGLLLRARQGLERAPEIR